MFDELTMAYRFVRDAGGFFRQTLTAAEGRSLIVAQMRQRSDMFLRLVERGMVAQPRSPYRALLNQAGIRLEHIKQWVWADGVETALHRLYDAGVYVTLGEFKARVPIRRGGFELPVRDGDFDNPLTAGHYQAHTGGSRSAGGVGRRLNIDLELMRYEAAYDRLFFEELNMLDTPKALWRPVPPGVAGINGALRYSVIGCTPVRWFSQTAQRRDSGHLKHYLFTQTVLLYSALAGKALPRPIEVPPGEAARVAEWLSEMVARGAPAYLNTNVGSMVRVCQAALARQLNIAGTTFRVGGEPYTPAKARVVADTGSRVLCHYSMSEIGRVGTACTAPAALDDVHVMTDKLAVLEKPVRVGAATVRALHYTTLLPSAPKLMLNVESGDTGVLEERDCGCGLQSLGLRQHLHTIRSYEKLTTEGMHFLGFEFLKLVEEVLPARFGGAPTDYQFVEEEVDALSKVSLVVSPRLGPIESADIIATTLEVLGSFPGGNNMMADYWRRGETLRVVRREPYTTAAAKIQPLHVIQSTQERNQ